MAKQIVSQQEMFAFIHEREFRSSSLMLKSLASGRFEMRTTASGPSARGVALGFIRHEALLLNVIDGSDLGVEIASSSAPADILAAYDAAHRKTRDALARLGEAQWNESLHVAELGLMESVRRGDLMWIALEDSIDQVERLASHLRSVERALAARELETFELTA